MSDEQKDRKAKWEEPELQEFQELPEEDGEYGRKQWDEEKHGGCRPMHDSCRPMSSGGCQPYGACSPRRWCFPQGSWVCAPRKICAPYMGMYPYCRPYGFNYGYGCYPRR